MNHTHILTITIALAAGTLLGTGCKKQEQPKTWPLYQQYSVKYDITRNKTMAFAYFNLMDPAASPVTFTDKAAVKVNGVTGLVSNTSNQDNFFWELDGTPDINYTLMKKDGTT